MRQWLWGLQFLRECTPARTRHNIEQIVRLGTYSRDTLQQLRRDIGIDYDERTQGILHFYTSQKEFDGAEGPAAQMRALGCDRRVISADEAVKLEPALRHIRPQLAGATYTAEDESGDANRFARELVSAARPTACSSCMSHTVTALREAGGKIDHVEATDSEGRFQRLRADAYVLAMGSWSRCTRSRWASAADLPGQGLLGDDAGKDASMAHQVSLTDDEYKLVFSRLGDRLRIAGTAELNGYDRDLNRVRCEAIVRRVEQLFPGAATASRRSSGPACGRRRRPTCRSSAARSCPICSSTPATARSAGRTRAARARASRASSAA